MLFLSKFSKFSMVSILSILTFFLEKESNKEKLFSFQILSLFEVRCRLRRLRSYFSRRSGFTSFCCSGLYEAFKGGFAARLIAPVLQGCDTKSFVSLTSLTLVHRPAAYAGYPPYPCATGLADYSLYSLLFVMPSHTPFGFAVTSPQVVYLPALYLLRESLYTLFRKYPFLF